MKSTCILVYANFWNFDTLMNHEINFQEDVYFNIYVFSIYDSSYVLNSDGTTTSNDDSSCNC